MEAQVSHFKVQNTNLVSYHWQTEIPKAVIVLVHGMGEHALRYENSVIKYLLKDGFSVVSYDNFGHGKTDGKRGHCPSYSALQDGVSKAIEKANLLYPNIPIFLYGHSMGGNLVLHYALTRNPDLAGIVATSPYLRYAINNAKQLKIPMLLCHGTGDTITSHDASKEFASKSDLVTIKLFEDGYHELHHDLCAKDMLNNVISWLNSNI